MERNWLIRTSQNQILGPVAKSKVLEFLQKGALGSNDEVTSGNGYWFSLKEKELVDKYLFGDIPQSYNPISEAKSVLSKRDNPDKTTSINTAPANKTQILKTSNTPGALPAHDDLEFPDITVVNNNLAAQLKLEQAPSDMKIPNPDDLEFPTLTAASSGPLPSYDSPAVQVKAKEVELKIVVPASNEPVVYPVDDDLAYPEIEKTDEFKITGLNPPKPVLQKVEDDEVHQIFENEPVEDHKLKLSTKSFSDKKTNPGIQLVHEEKKLLHEKKVKASAAPAATEIPKKAPDRSMPEHLKKRNDNYLLYLLIILVLIIVSLFFYYYSTILNKPLPV